MSQTKIDSVLNTDKILAEIATVQRAMDQASASARRLKHELKTARLMSWIVVLGPWLMALGFFVLSATLFFK